MNCLIVAGEKSGEEHCLSFLPELQKELPSCEFWGVGGDAMIALGFKPIYHLNQFSSWGFTEVIHKVPFYMKAMRAIEREIVEKKCCVAILIDFQTFNLTLAKRLKRRGVKVLYYVAPQAWAWKAWRAKVLSEVVHTLFTIIPFEKRWFKERGVNQVKGITHPLGLTYKSELAEFKRENVAFSKSRNFNLLLLPGSRLNEVQRLLPVFIASIELLKSQGWLFNLSIVKSSTVDERYFRKYNGYFNVVYTDTKLTEALKRADLCLACSGTVTLACALFGLPTVVTYKVSRLNEFIIRSFIRYKWFVSLTNIIHERMLYPELLQDDASPQKIVEKFSIWLENRESYNEIVSELIRTKELIVGESDVPQYMGRVIADASSSS